MLGMRQHLSNVHIKFCDKGCAGKSGREALMDLLIEWVMNLFRSLTPLQTRIKWNGWDTGRFIGSTVILFFGAEFEMHWQLQDFLKPL